MSLKEGWTHCYSLLLTMACWLLSQGRYKIGVGTAEFKGPRDNRDYFSFTVRVGSIVFFLVVGKRKLVSQLHTLPSMTLLTIYDKRIRGFS
jgi:hypothetical protein